MHITNDNNYVIILYCVGMWVFGEWKYILIIIIIILFLGGANAIYL